MAEHLWKTLSVRLTEEEENALKLLCEKRGQNKHALMKEILLQELEPLLKPGHLIEGEGIPLIGEHIFKYAPEKDNFTWQIDLGAQGTRALAENVPFSFIDNLNNALEKAVQEHEKTVIPKKKTRIPKSILKYEVK